MSTESALNKRLRPETTFDKIEGILEHLNLPAPTIQWIRRYRKLLTTVLILVIIGVISYSVYKSYREKLVEDAASALSLAAVQSGDEKIAALRDVAKSFDSTNSGRWAEINIAQTLVSDGKFEEGATLYSDLQAVLESKNPLYALVVYGKATAFEGAKSYDQAISAYKELQKINGYEALAYLGEGKILEEKGEATRAIAIYNDYILLAGKETRLAGEVPVFQARVAKLKAVENN